jgi:predicted transcriptional regulator
MKAKKDWWDEIGEELKVAIDKALAEVKAGKVTPHEEVMKKYDHWRNKGYKNTSDSNIN